jgi:hypothetical protein
LCAQKKIRNTGAAKFAKNHPALPDKIKKPDDGLSMFFIGENNETIWFSVFNRTVHDGPGFGRMFQKPGEGRPGGSQRAG